MKKDFAKTNVYNFSGGATSGYMTIMCNPGPNDIVLFTDTGIEHDDTYKYLDDFEKYEGIKVHRATYTHEKKSPGLTGMDALLNWKKYLPNRERRLCTDELKVKTAKRYLRSLGIQHFNNFIGFRADEPDRVVNYYNQYEKVNPVFPLYNNGINKAMIDAYWATKPYKLRIPRILGNCTLCFLKGKNAIIRILQVHPELAEPWIRWEASAKRDGRAPRFIKDITYAQMLDIATRQKGLFDDDMLESIDPAFNCSCNNS